jgi:hypothetical protein
MLMFRLYAFSPSFFPHPSATSLHALYCFAGWVYGLCDRGGPSGGAHMGSSTHPRYPLFVFACPLFSSLVSLAPSLLFISLLRRWTRLSATFASGLTTLLTRKRARLALRSLRSHFSPFLSPIYVSLCPSRCPSFCSHVFSCQVVCADVFGTEGKIDHIAQRLKLPDVTPPSNLYHHSKSRHHYVTSHHLHKLCTFSIRTSSHNFTHASGHLPSHLASYR